jgi:hypothetical protein
MNLAEMAGLQTVIEPGKFMRRRVIDGEERLDAVEPDLIVLAQNETYWIDVSIADPTCKSHVNAAISSATKIRKVNGQWLTPGRGVARHREAEKKRKYEEFVKLFQRTDHPLVMHKEIKMVPAVMETTGAMGEELEAFLLRLSCHAVEEDMRIGREGMFVRQAKRMLAVSLAEGNAECCHTAAGRMATGINYFKALHDAHGPNGGLRTRRSGGKARNRSESSIVNQAKRQRAVRSVH